MRYKHFLWDFDGTLYDTYPLMTRCFDYALRQCGVQADMGEIQAQIKISTGAAYHYYQEKYGFDPSFDFFGAYRAYQSSLPLEAMTPYPGIPELIRETRALGAHHHLYTHRDRAALRALELNGILDCFEGRITSQDHFPAKPAPDAILSLINRGLVDPTSACMMGDRDIDLEAAHNAGIDGCLFDPDHFYDDYQTEHRVYTVEEMLEWMKQ